MDKLIDLEKIAPNCILDVRYATTNNFLGEILYTKPKIFLREKVAEKIAKVQLDLEQQGCSLKIFDGYRPLSVQKLFWEFLPDDRYIADPSVGSKHNRGAAVDVTIVNSKNGQELVMPTPFDDFTTKAHSNCMDLPDEAIENRHFLRYVMSKQGFMQLPTEWWHFDDEHYMNYPVEDVSFEELEIMSNSY